VAGSKIPEPVFYQGRVVGEARRFSDTLAMFILKSKRREVWGERHEVHVKEDWSKFTVEERERPRPSHARQARTVAAQRKELADLRAGKRPEIIYDPTDADELAEAAAREAENGDPEGGRSLMSLAWIPRGLSGRRFGEGSAAPTHPLQVKNARASQYPP
jgi:hypothetical protein